MAGREAVGGADDAAAIAIAVVGGQEAKARQLFRGGSVIVRGCILWRIRLWWPFAARGQTDEPGREEAARQLDMFWQGQDGQAGRQLGWPVR